GARGGSGDRLRAGGSVRAEEDLAQRRPRVRSGGGQSAPALAPRGDGAGRQHPVSDRIEEEVLQLGSGCGRPTSAEPADHGAKPVKYRYTKYTGDPLEDLDLEDLVSKLSDLLLASGFGNPYAMGDEERTMQALHDAILDALFNGGVLPEETIERLLGDPADA